MDFKEVLMPPMENRLLPTLDKQPFLAPGSKGYKYPKRVADCRGPELIHNKFMYKQYGVMVSSVTHADCLRVTVCPGAWWREPEGGAHHSDEGHREQAPEAGQDVRHLEDRSSLEVHVSTEKGLSIGRR